MAENFLNPRKQTGYPDQEAQGAQNKMNPKIPTEIYHKWQREMQRVPKKRSLIRLSAHISAETSGKNGMAYIQSGERKNTRCSTQQSYHSELKER